MMMTKKNYLVPIKKIILFAFPIWSRENKSFTLQCNLSVENTKNTKNNVRSFLTIAC